MWIDKKKMCTPIVILSEGHVSHVQRFFFFFNTKLFFWKKFAFRKLPTAINPRGIFLFFFAQGKGMNINNPGVAYDI